jgi:hypothetical protein
MTFNLRRAVPAACIVFAASALAACGGSAGTSNDQVASLGSGDGSTRTRAAANTSTTSSESFQTALLSFAKCMRDNGVDFPDPTFGSNGRPIFNGNGSAGGGSSSGPAQVLNIGGVQLNGDDPKVKAAMSRCQPILQKARPQQTPEQQQAQQQAALKYAQCMRQNGINMPDPTFGPNGEIQIQVQGGAGGAPNDAKFRAADEKCRSAFQNVPGGPPGGGGTSTQSTQ